MPWRRRRLFCLAAGLIALLGCATVTGAVEPRAVALADGVYWLPGSGGTADADNRGRIGNAGFIVGDSGVIAIDTGTSHSHGLALLAAIRAVTDKPVKLALITHTRPEFLFGGEAFRAQGIPIRMHGSSARLMAARCETCLKTLRQTLGDEVMRGTAMYKPDQVFDTSHELALIGRPLRVLSFGHSSGPGDIAVLDLRSGVLFAGGLIDVRRVPDIQDGELPGWRRALAALQELGARTIVPGHGRATPAPAAIAAMQTYFDQLEARARALVAQGVSLIDVPEASELPAYQAWDQYETIHRRNASIAFLRAERETMLK
jgi:glyoxylase-like metal-dependent hydrolase (beta-lactamase superfamily II)